MIMYTVRRSAVIPSCTLTGEVRITEVTRPSDRHKATDTLCAPEFSCSLTVKILKLEISCTKGTELPSCGCAQHGSHHMSTHTGSYRNHGRVNCRAWVNLLALGKRSSDTGSTCCCLALLRISKSLGMFFPKCLGPCSDMPRKTNHARGYPERAPDKCPAIFGVPTAKLAGHRH